MQNILTSLESNTNCLPAKWKVSSQLNHLFLTITKQNQGENGSRHFRKQRKMTHLFHSKQILNKYFFWRILYHVFFSQYLERKGNNVYKSGQQIDISHLGSLTKHFRSLCQSPIQLNLFSLTKSLRINPNNKKQVYSELLCNFTYVFFYTKSISKGSKLNCAENYPNDRFANYKHTYKRKCACSFYCVKIQLYKTKYQKAMMHRHNFFQS